MYLYKNYYSEYIFSQTHMPSANMLSGWLGGRLYRRTHRQEPFPCHGIPYNWQVPTDNMTLSTQMSKKSYRRLSSEAHSLWPETFHIFQKSDFHLLPQCNKIFPTVRLQSNNLSVCHLWQCRQAIGLATHFQMSKTRMRKQTQECISTGFTNAEVRLDALWSNQPHSWKFLSPCIFPGKQIYYK